MWAINTHGVVGREFVQLLTDELGLLADGKSVSERLMCLTPMLLGRDDMIRKSCDIRCLVAKRMELWKSDHFDALASELERCAGHLTRRSKQKMDDTHTIRVFSRLMLCGKVKDATRWITGRTAGRVLESTDIDSKSGKTVLDVLKEKHPPPGKLNPNAFLHCDPLPHLVDIDVTAAHVEQVAHHCRGAAGPSGTDAIQWQRFLLRYGIKSNHLREAVAALTRRLSNSVVEWTEIKALMANCLVALDKCPGVRPIGIGESLRRIVGKTMALVTGGDVQDLCGAEQLATGLKSGVEGAIHAMTDLYDEFSSDGWGFLLVDAVNAFNLMSRVTALWNARILWPRCSRFLFNTYRGFAVLLLRNSEEFLYSREGVTQGDPLSMLLYAAAMMPLVNSLRCREQYQQSWYADDSACAGSLNSIHSWLDCLIERGPTYGYFPEPTKSVVVVASKYVEIAKSAFQNVGVKVVTGHRFLGGVVGEREFCVQFVREKVDVWVDCVDKLSQAAIKAPQAAFASLTKSLQCEWDFLQRVVPDCADAFTPLNEKSSSNSFQLCLVQVSLKQRRLCLLYQHL